MERYQAVLFCERVLRREDESVEKIKTSFAPIDVESLCLTKDNIGEILSKISQILFRDKTQSIGNVYAFLVFSLNVDEYLSSTDWYSKDILVALIAKILYDIKFRPIILVERSYIERILNWVYGLIFK